MGVVWRNEVENRKTLETLFRLTTTDSKIHGDLEGHNNSHGDLTVDNSRHLLFNKIMGTMLIMKLTQFVMLVSVDVAVATRLTSVLEQSLLQVNDVLTKS